MKDYDIAIQIPADEKVEISFVDRSSGNRSSSAVLVDDHDEVKLIDKKTDLGLARDLSNLIIIWTTTTLNPLHQVDKISIDFYVNEEKVVSYSESKTVDRFPTNRIFLTITS